MTSTTLSIFRAPVGAGTRVLWLALALVLASVLALAWGASVGSTGFDSLRRAFDDPAAAQIVWDLSLIHI